MRKLVIQKILKLRDKLIMHNFNRTGLLIFMNHEINEKTLGLIYDEDLLEILEGFIIDLKEYENDLKDLDSEE